MAISQTQSDFFRKHHGRISKTAFIRFDVSERLSRDEKFNIVLSSVLSLYLICSSVVFFAADSYGQSSSGMTVAFIGIVAAMALLVISLLDHSERRSVKSQIMLENAKAIHQIAHRLDLEMNSDNPTFESLSKLVKEYHVCLNDTSLNHGSRDNSRYECSEKIRGGNFLYYPILWWHISARLVESKWLPMLVLAGALLGFWLMLLEAWVTIEDILFV